MDGRIQEPIISFVKEKYGCAYVDTITEPGPCKVLAGEELTALHESIKNRILISLEKHGSTMIFISGHHDCAGNPVSKEIQIEQIGKSAKYLQSQYPGAKVVQLWVDENWHVSKL
jgi:hypothetical protein